MKHFSIYALLLVSACTSGGSDIGPKLEDVPDASFKVLVRDGQDRGVSNAVIRVSGEAVIGATEKGGRADLPIGVGGSHVVTIDASNASAAAGDRLASISIAESLTRTGELPFTIFLPDLSASADLAVNAGMQASASTLNDSASSGAILDIASGAVLGLGTATSGVIRTASLASEQLPGRLPLPVVGLQLAGRGVFIGPSELSIVPGAALSVPNDLNLNAGEVAELFHLDSATGVWSMVATGTVNTGATRIETGPGVVTMGGLYCFAFDQSTQTVISGRVLDRDNFPVPGVLVQTSQASVRSGGDGRFTLPAIASLDGQAAARTLDVFLHGGRDYLPSSHTENRVLTSPTLDLGDLTLDSKRITQVRALVIHRGRAEQYRRFSVSGYDSLGAAQGLLGADGKVTFKDLEFGRFGSGGARLDPGLKENLLNIEFVNLDQKLHSTVDFLLFTSAVLWIPLRGGGAQTRVLDRDGRGEILGADIYTLLPGDDRFLLRVDEFVDKRLPFASASFATASFSSIADNRRVISAFSATEVNLGRVELPLERANRQAFGTFDSHSLVSGTLAGRGSGNTLLLTPTRSLIIDNWHDEVFAGKSVRGQYPTKLDPGVVGGADFVVGVGRPQGNLAVIEGQTTSGVLTLQRMWLSKDLRPAIDKVTAVDLGPAHDVAANFSVQGAVAGMDAALVAADLSFDLGIEFPDRQVIDIARGVAGNASISGSDVDFSLPDLSGSLAGSRYLLGWGGSTVNAGTTIEQKLLLPLVSSTQTSAGFLAVPTITTPAAGATVAATGFSVQFNVPTGTLYSLIQLRSETATEVRDWTVMVPDTVNGFDFRNLPQGADPLAAGNFTITVTSVRTAPAGPLSAFDLPYQGVVARSLTLGPAQLGVEAISSASISVTIN